MVNTLFPRFLEDAGEYDRAERYWLDLWDQIDGFPRTHFGWRSPWLGTGSPSILDGNPIFSAWSPMLRRGIRVIQEEPVGPGLDIRAWLDTFGGDTPDPDRIHELVISCVLSEEPAHIARSLMEPWVRGDILNFRTDEVGHLQPSSRP